MLQQLQDAGLMQHLPESLCSAAAELTDMLATNADRSVAKLHAYLDMPADLLTITAHVIQLHRGLPAVLQAHAVLTPAACGLIAAAMRYISGHLHLQQQQCQQLRQLTQHQQKAQRHLLQKGTAVVLAAREYVASLGGSVHALGGIPAALRAEPQLQQLLDSPDLVPFLVLQLAVVSQGLLVQQPLQELRAAAAAEKAGSRTERRMQGTRRSGSSDNSSSSSSSSSSVSTSATAEGEQPLALLQQLQAQQRLPPTTPCQQRLFELLGVDSITLAWASQCDSASHSTRYFTGLLRLHRKVVKEQQQQQEEEEEDEEEEEGAATKLQLHLLLPAVLLPCAARLCKPGSAAAAALGLSMAEQGRLCMFIAAVSCTSLDAWHAQDGVAGSSSCCTADELQLWLGELRSLVLLVLHEVLHAIPQQQQQQQQQAGPLPATTPAAGGCADTLRSRSSIRDASPKRFRIQMSRKSGCMLLPT
jgi:hypothetical protein